MAKEVTKRDGTKEPFDPEKIRNSIEAATEEAGISEERKKKLVKEVGDKIIQMVQEKKEITTRKIKEAILAELDTLEPAVSEAWRTYEEEKKG